MAGVVTLTIPRTVDNSKADLNGATFTGPVSAPSFTGNLVGNANTATKATQDGNGNIITATYALKSAVPTKMSDLTNDLNFITSGYTGTFVITGDLSVSGTITGGKVVGATYANDYAEWFEKEESVETEPGDIIALDDSSDKETYVKATTNSKVVVGVHSGEWGYITGGNPELSLEENTKHYIPIALTGRIHVKVIGPCNIGDVIVPSEIPGVGRALSGSVDFYNVIGRVLQTDTQNGIRLIRVLIK